ncbi:polysaccharide deacetylase family protein [Puniceicoccaceae bacterium K14]|nr:polysaccharide deacetylase family protein [Puniceicoccaceae bacterium K14]
MKIAIIKADDIKGVDERFLRFIETSKNLGIKVSCGIICESLENPKKEYVEWMLAEQKQGFVEFWNHGWDHKRWNENEETISEFGGSGYAHQKEHFVDSQNAIKRILGQSPISFGSPYNAFDADTKRVISEDESIRLLFCYRDPNLENVVPAFMALRGEPDGTGNPNAAKFIDSYNQKNDITFSAIQFHPANFDDQDFVEYEKTITFLLEKDWVFMLPSEYITWLEDKSK